MSREISDLQDEIIEDVIVEDGVDQDDVQVGDLTYVSIVYNGGETDNIIVNVDNDNRIITATVKPIQFVSRETFPEIGSDRLLYVSTSDDAIYRWDTGLNDYVLVGKDYTIELAEMGKRILQNTDEISRLDQEIIDMGSEITDIQAKDVEQDLLLTAIEETNKDRDIKINALETKSAEHEQDLAANEKAIQANSDAIATLTDESGNTIEISVDPATYILTLNLKNKAGTTISTGTVDLPLETMVVSASYKDGTLTLTLQNGQTVDIDISSIVDGLVNQQAFDDEITRLDGEITTLQGEVTAHDLTLTAIEETNKDRDTKINALETKANEHEQELADYEVRIGESENAISDLQEQADATDENVTQLTTRVGTDETNIATNTQDIAGLKSTTAQHTTDIQDIKDNYATKQYVDENGGKIDSISVNGQPQTIDEQKNVDISVPTKLSELQEDETHRVVSDTEKAEWSGKQDKLIAGDNITISDDNTISAIIPTSDIDTLKQDVSEIQSKIPTQASATNQLVDKNFLNSTVNSLAAFYITKNADGDPFATNAELLAADTFYNGTTPRVPTTNDYAIVQADETKADELGDHPTTRYSYQGGTYPNGKWVFQYIVNRTSLTAAQIAAINSNITAELTAQITTNKNNIAGKASQSDLTALTTRVTATETKNTSQDTEIDKKANTSDLANYIPKTDIKTMTEVGDIGYGEAADRNKVISVEALSWWNGAYMGTNSNLQYFKNGEIAGKDEIPRPLWMADSIVLEDTGIESDYTIPKKNISLLAANGYTIKGSDKIIFSTTKATYLGVVKSTTDIDVVVTPKFDMATVAYVDQQGGGGADDAVLFTEQTLTTDQQTQARKNIGAGTSNFDGNYSSLSGTPTLGSLANKSSITDADVSDSAAIAQSKISGLIEALNAKATTEALNAVKSTADGAATAAAAAQSTANGKYSKPSTGIPATDLASAVQTSLGKADNSIQNITGDSNIQVTIKSDKTVSLSFKPIILGSLTFQDILTNSNPEYFITAQHFDNLKQDILSRTTLAEMKNVLGIPKIIIL